MFGKMLSDIVDVAVFAAKVVAAPIALTAAVGRELTKPIGDAAQDAVDAVSEGIRDHSERAKAHD